MDDNEIKREIEEGIARIRRLEKVDDREDALKETLSLLEFIKTHSHDRPARFDIYRVDLKARAGELERRVNQDRKIQQENALTPGRVLRDIWRSPLKWLIPPLMVHVVILCFSKNVWLSAPASIGSGDLSEIPAAIRGIVICIISLAFYGLSYLDFFGDFIAAWGFAKSGGTMQKSDAGQKGCAVLLIRYGTLAALYWSSIVVIMNY